MIFRHTHDFQVAAVEHSSTETPPGVSTVILWRCECADVFSERIEGVWTLSQVRGEIADAPDQHGEIIKAAGAEVISLSRGLMERLADGDG